MLKKNRVKYDLRKQALLHKQGQWTDPSCALCHELEDVKQFLMKCPAQQQLQHELRNYCGQNNRRLCIKSILTSEDCGDIIYDFIKSSASFL